VKKLELTAVAAMNTWFYTSSKLSKLAERGEQNGMTLSRCRSPLSRLSDIICPINNRLDASHESD